MAIEVDRCGCYGPGIVPCFLSNSLAEYDRILWEILGTLHTENDPAWMQVSLPVKQEGLSVRRDVQLAPSA